MLRDRSRAVGREIPVVVKKPRKKLALPPRETVTSSLLERYPPELVRPEKPKSGTPEALLSAPVPAVDNAGDNDPVGYTVYPPAAAPAPVMLVEAKTPTPP